MNLLLFVTFCLLAVICLVETLERLPDNVKMRLLYDESVKVSNPSAYYPKRPEQATRTHRCGIVDHHIPSHLSFITRYRFYSKYTHAYGIPIIASSVVSDEALKRACYVTRFLFADRSDIRENMYKYYGRVAVIGKNQKLLQIPEFSHLPAWWNKRARGLGATLRIPVSCGGEENLLCLRNDRYYGDDIFFHETAHAVAELAIKGGPNGDLDGLYSKLQRHYNNAKRRGLWRYTYSMDTVREYFAEGAQSFFNCHVSVNPPNGIHSNINTRDKLLRYDPGLYGFLEEVFPCKNTYHWCYKGAQPDMKMDCPKRGPRPTQTQQNVTQVTQPPIPETCENNHKNCDYWSEKGYCQEGQHRDYMHRNCKKSCLWCIKGPTTGVDRNPNCATWAKDGHCSNNTWMKANCCISCQLCTPAPTKGTTTGPTNGPTTGPTIGPTAGQTTEPTRWPTIEPTKEPNTGPTTSPTAGPTTEPTMRPTTLPTTGPTRVPTTEQTTSPTTGPRVSTTEPTTSPTTGSTTGPTKGPTTKGDKNKNCAAWAKKGYCPFNPSWMKANCCKSCRLCTTGPTTGTTKGPTTRDDKNKNCAAWAKKGYCPLNPSWMKANCCKSCRLCTTDPTTGPTTGPTDGPTEGPTEGPTTRGDKDTNCAAWASVGYCVSHNPSWMKENCCKSCGRC